MKRTITQLILTVIVMPLSLMSQSPANLNADIAWSAGYVSIQDIEGAYNFARREEEIQMGLAVNSLGNLVLPTDWFDYSPNQRALFIVNDERISRGGRDYGNGPCLGLPMDALENNLQGLAQSHADWLGVNNAFSHTGENNWSPFQRIDNDPVLGTMNNCHDFLTRAENLTAFFTSGNFIPLPIEQSIYGWIYDDASSNWGHREAVLLQDEDLNGNLWGYTNNYLSTSSEGFLGVGLVETINGSWNPFNFSWVDASTLVVLNVMDPVSSANCTYQVPASAPGALPIELVDFYGREKEKTMDLKWLTATELNNDFFSVQHSADGKNFKEIGIVKGAGTTDEAQRYQFIHENPVEGINYYRLEQFDLDGSSNFSKIIAIRMINKWSATLYPNPVVDTDLSVNVLSESVEQIEFSVYDMNGKLILNQQNSLEKGLNKTTIAVTNLPKGFYTLILSNNEKTEVQKFSVL